MLKWKSSELAKSKPRIPKYGSFVSPKKRIINPVYSLKISTCHPSICTPKSSWAFKTNLCGNQTHLLNLLRWYFGFFWIRVWRTFYIFCKFPLVLFFKFTLLFWWRQVVDSRMLPLSLAPQATSDANADIYLQYVYYGFLMIALPYAFEAPGFYYSCVSYSTRWAQHIVCK